MADHKSSIISALVSQMKTGQISKNDLFEQLSTLQRPENITSYDDDDNDNNNNNNNNKLYLFSSFTVYNLHQYTSVFFLKKKKLKERAKITI